ncbi:hypothetical protein H1R20_g15160, partial [Candolleomyces eurysporus]
MPPPQPKPPKPQLKRQKSGLLTGVFNFVSQEVQNFVANATGTVDDEEVVGEEEYDEEEYGSDEYEEYEEELKDGEQQVPEPSPVRTKSRHTPPRKKSVRRSPSSEKSRKRVPERTPSPRPILTRRPSKPQMPGSLFPLSPSPDDASDDDSRPERHVHFEGASGRKGKAPAKPYDRTFGSSKSSTASHRDETSEMPPPPPPLNPKPIPTSTSSAPTIGVDAELKIQQLEQEVQRLRDELARRPPRQPTPSLYTGLAPPPPPPPPPPPTGTIFRVPTESSNPDAVFASVRAALKHTTPPKEKPINKLNGKPCIGVPPDKMAAFLTEMKTVRLKKVSDRSFASDGDLSSLSFSQHDRTFDHSFGVGSIASEKRKRPLIDDHTSGELERALKRRSMTNLRVNNGDRSFGSSTSSSSTTRNASANSSFESTSTSASTSASNTSSTSQPSSQLLPSGMSRSHTLIREWRTGTASTSSSQTDAPTPSLCSDQDGGESHDDPGPSTPPNNILPLRPPTPPLRKDNTARDILPEEIQYEISLRAPPSPVSPPPSFAGPPLGPPARVTSARLDDAEDTPMLMTRQPSTSTTKLDKRQPVSPLPNKSPRRPRPPARPLSINHSSKNLPRRVLVLSDDEDEEDPLSLSFDTSTRSLPLSLSLSQSQTQTRPRYSLPRRVIVHQQAPPEEDGAEATPTPAPKPPPSSTQEGR